MGLSSFLKKTVKSVGLGGIIGNQLQGLLGLGGGQDDLARQQEAAMRANAEAMKLQNANNALSNVVQFEDGGTNTLGMSDQKRKRVPTGSYAGGLGLNS